ncbi:hypothetical protein F3J14_19650 [Burkholderia sp. Tr-862]|uniref:hypothetical protein n=1 Tax=Burkholderia sp. Tr-862 TaxID=2608331 RepID=UPI001419E8F9|nr:hypothetical protein [Burkholderia sp. Tr-862]NIF43064.1 hypothetical protein [Burkholderia sp. Tr-862]
MRDKYDHVTLDLFPNPETATQLPCAAQTRSKADRVKKEGALSDAERAKRYRTRKKARLAELRDETVPVSSSVIDLSALPAWKRK